MPLPWSTVEYNYVQLGRYWNVTVVEVICESHPECCNLLITQTQLSYEFHDFPRYMYRFVMYPVTNTVVSTLVVESLIPVCGACTRGGNECAKWTLVQNHSKIGSAIYQTQRSLM
jgi:hypothetical protein